MATRKTTTRAKTKTTKRRTSAARTTKTAAKSAAVTRAVKQEAKTNGTLLGWDIILSLGMAIAAVVLMRSDAVSLTMTHLTNDLLLSREGTVFVTAYKPLFDLELRWILASLLLISTIVPILYLTKLKAYYAAGMTKRRYIGGRWINLAVSSALMLETIALLVGISDLMTLKLMGALIGVTCALGWLAERQNAASSTPVWSAFGISTFTGLMPWVAIGLAHTGTLLFGEVRSPWYVYALCWSTLIGFTLLAWNQYKQYRDRGDYLKTERNYLTINLLTKSAFALILIIGLLK